MMIEWAESNPCQLIRRANLTTLGKNPSSKPWSPSLEWCKAQVLAEDSTSEFASIIIYDDIRGDVVNQLVRATAYHPRHEVSSSRPDWTGKPRPGPEVPRMYMGKWDIKALIAMSRQRLCYRAMKETREESERIKSYLANSSDLLMQAAGWACVPDCIYRSGCVAGGRSCNWFNNGFDADGWSSVEERYDLYNEWFVKYMEDKTNA